jgi:sirohydrochlorin ferrochelatase
MSLAYLLVSHGSRDIRPQISLLSLAQMVRQQLTSRTSADKISPIPDKLSTTAVLTQYRSPLVGTACLELSQQQLHETICQFALEARSLGLKSVEILPLFLLPGVHVTEDLPNHIALARQKLEGKIEIHLQPYLGTYPAIKTILAKQFDRLAADGRILLSHGSRRAGSTQPIETIAASLQAIPAYRSIAPSLEMQVETLVKAGKNTIAILPYFLFAGGITDAIADNVKQLPSQFPQTQLLLGQPIGASADLANLIVRSLEI